MYASIRRYRFKPGAAHEITQRAQAGFVPIISRAPGFVAYYLVVESDEVGASISIFDSREQAEHSNQVAADWVKENLANLVEGPPTIMAGEVTASKVGVSSMA